MKIRETLKHKYEKIGNYLFSYIRRKRLNNTYFTIICNNCWGGYVYRFFGLPYSSPTMGLYINPPDFLRLLGDIKGYLESPLTFIKPEQSRYYEELKRKGQLNVPIGVIGNVEIVFLHYKSEQEALDKWARRVARVNYDNIIVKFSQMNGCKLDDLEEFNKLEFKKMFMFVNRKEIAQRFKKAIYFKGQEHYEELYSDTTFFNTYINLYELVNSECYPESW